MAKRKQVTAKNNANTNEEINPITLEQLQDVQVLRRKIQAHGRHVNRFTSINF